METIVELQGHAEGYEEHNTNYQHSVSAAYLWKWFELENFQEKINFILLLKPL